MSKIGKLSELRKSAKKVEPYTLDTGEETIKINPPGTRSLLSMGKHREDPEKVLELLTGDAYERVYDAIADEPVEVFNALLEDIMDAFGLSNGEQADPTKQ